MYAKLLIQCVNIHIIEDLKVMFPVYVLNKIKKKTKPNLIVSISLTIFLNNFK